LAIKENKDLKKQCEETPMNPCTNNEKIRFVISTVFWKRGTGECEKEQCSSKEELGSAKTQKNENYQIRLTKQPNKRTY
jgi:hypothetical protein